MLSVSHACPDASADFHSIQPLLAKELSADQRRIAEARFAQFRALSALPCPAQLVSIFSLVGCSSVSARAIVRALLVERGDRAALADLERRLSSGDESSVEPTHNRLGGGIERPSPARPRLAYLPYPSALVGVLPPESEAVLQGLVSLVRRPYDRLAAGELLLCTPRLNLLAAFACLSERSTKRALRTLEERRFIVRSGTQIELLPHIFEGSELMTGRSRHRRHYVPIPRALDGRLAPVDRAVVTLLLSRLGTGIFERALAGERLSTELPAHTIAASLAVSQWTVYRAIRRLERCAILRCHRRGRAGYALELDRSVLGLDEEMLAKVTAETKNTGIFARERAAHQHACKDHGHEEPASAGPSFVRWSDYGLIYATLARHVLLTPSGGTTGFVSRIRRVARCIASYRLPVEFVETTASQLARASGRRPSPERILEAVYGITAARAPLRADPDV